MYKNNRLCTPAFVAGCIASSSAATVTITAAVVSVTCEPYDYNNCNYNPYKTRAAENAVI